MWRDRVRSVAACALVLTAWEIVSRSGYLPRALFPPPSAVLLAGLAWWRDGELLRDCAASLWRALVGYMIGASAGLAVGILTGRSASVAILTRPVVQALRPLPPVAIVPLIIVWLGIGNAAKLFAIAFATFFPVWVATDIGARTVPDAYLWSARLLGASRLRMFLAIVLPSAMTVAVGGLRTAVSLAFVMVFVSELAGASDGIGYQIATSHLAYRIDRMMAALAALALLGVVTDAALSRGIQVVMPWTRGGTHNA